MRSLLIGGLFGAAVFFLFYTHTIGYLPLDHYPLPKLLVYAAAMTTAGALAGWLLAWFGNRN